MAFVSELMGRAVVDAALIVLTGLLVATSLLDLAPSAWAAG